MMITTKRYKYFDVQTDVWAPLKKFNRMFGDKECQKDIQGSVIVTGAPLTLANPSPTFPFLMISSDDDCL